MNLFLLLAGASAVAAGYWRVDRRMRDPGFSGTVWLPVAGPSFAGIVLVVAGMAADGAQAQAVGLVAAAASAPAAVHAWTKGSNAGALTWGSVAVLAACAMLWP